MQIPEHAEPPRNTKATARRSTAQLIGFAVDAGRPCMFWVAVGLSHVMSMLQVPVCTSEAIDDEKHQQLFLYKANEMLWITIVHACSPLHT